MSRSGRFLGLTRYLRCTAVQQCYVTVIGFIVGATLKSIDYNVAMTFILNNNNNNRVYRGLAHSVFFI